MVIEALDWVFFIIFDAECVLKIAGLGRRQYFRMQWNRFDFFIVVMSTVDKIVASLPLSLPWFKTVARLLRVEAGRGE